MYVPVLILIQPMRKLNDSNDYYVKCVWEEWVWNLAVISLNLLVTESMIPRPAYHACCMRLQPDQSFCRVSNVL